MESISYLRQKDLNRFKVPFMSAKHVLARYSIMCRVKIVNTIIYALYNITRNISSSFFFYRADRKFVIVVPVCIC